MKKFILFLVLFFVFSINVYAVDNKFNLGEKISGIYIITDKNGKKVFAQIKKIQRTDTNELVYCTQPGTVLSSEEYIKYDSNNYTFRLNSETIRKIKLIAHYGYMYQDHTDIKWYAITQFLIWKEVLPENWDLYFTNSNKVRNDNLFINEISEINNLVNNHKDKPTLLGNYSFNYQSDIKIIDENSLLNNYNFSLGNNINNVYSVSDLMPGLYNINATLSSFKEPIFYHHETGQDVFDKGDVLERSFNFNIRIMGGKIKINECDQNVFDSLILGGTYEVLNENDEYITTISCSPNEECLSSYLPVGKYKIKVKNISDEYILNENIFNVLINDGTVTEENICYLKKKIENKEKEEPIENNESNTVIDEKEEEKNEDFLEVYIPSTYKTFTFVLVIVLVIISSIGIFYFFYENNL